MARSTKSTGFGSTSRLRMIRRLSSTDSGQGLECEADGIACGLIFVEIVEEAEETVGSSMDPFWLPSKSAGPL